MTAQSGLGFSGIVAIQIPDDGATGFVLTKTSPDNYDYDWAAGGGGGASTVIVEDEGIVVGVPADTLNFVGAGVTATGAGTTKTITIPGGASTLQAAYDAATAPPQIVINATDELTIAASAAGIIFALQNSAAAIIFSVASTTAVSDVIEFGVASQRLFAATNVVAGYGGVEFYPDNFTRTLDFTFGSSAFFWGSIITSAVPGGGGIGNDTAPNFVEWRGELILTEQGNLFSTQSLFSQSTTVTCQGANTGPIYTMINQPLLRTGSLGGSRTGSQSNAVRSQLRVGPNLAGNFTLASHETFFAFCSVDATVGTASITAVNYFAARAPGLIAGGTIGTLNCLDISNIPAAGITTLRGINSAMGSGTFINHTGVAPSAFAGPIVMGNAVAITFGTATAISLDRVAANVLRMLGNAEDLRWTFGADNVAITSTTSAGLQVNLGHISFGSSVTSGNPNWFVEFAAPNLRSPGAAGGYADVLWTAGGSIAIGALAMSDVSAFQINSIATTLAGGSIADSSTLYLAGMAASNATRVHALRVTGRARIDGHINQGSQSPASIGANTNDWQLAANNNQRGVVLLTSSGAFNITGIDSSFGFAQGGDFLVIINTSGNTMSFTHQDVLSLAANRFIMATGATVAVLAGRSIRFWYDVAASRWRHILPV